MVLRVVAACVGVLGLMGCSSKGGGGEATGVSAAPSTSPVQVEASRCAAPLGLDVVPAGDERSGSTVVMARVHGRLLAYVADEDESAVHILDVEGLTPARELGQVKVPGHPGRMLMLPGGRLAILLTDRAEVAMYTPAPLADDVLDLHCTLPTPDEPVDLAETPDRKTLLVVTDWSHTLVGFDPDSGERRFDVDLPRASRAVVVSADGAHAYIAHAAGGAMSVVDLGATPPSTHGIDIHGADPPTLTLSARDEANGMAVTILDDDIAAIRKADGHREDAIQKAATEKLKPRSACQGFALAELAGPEPRILSPMVEVAPGNVRVPSTGYGSREGPPAEVPVVAVVDEVSGKTVKDSVGAFGDSGCLLPRAAVVSHGSLYVACMGTDSEVVEFDTSARVPKMRRRWHVQAGPTGLAIHGSRAVVWSQFAGTASILSLTMDRWRNDPTDVVSVSRRPPTDEEEETALGRALFHASGDFHISNDGRACASCHPNGRDDGLVWSTPGGPRQTPMLAGRLRDTAPYGWDGAGSDLSHHLDHTLARLGGFGLEPKERAALIRYISTLPGPSAHPSTAASGIERGQAVFLSSGCASCHSVEGGWTDGRSHEVSSRVRADTVAAFDTPSLRFVGGTAPYFHDGRYSTLRDLLTRSDGPMGAARKMPAEDIDALETFVRSL